MTEYLFLYTRPFIIKNPSTTVKHDNILDYLDEFSRADEARIRNIIIKFAAESELVTKNSNDDIVLNPGEDMSSWQWAVCCMNFRSLVVHSQYGILMQSLINGNNSPIDKIIELHTRLGSMFGNEILNTIVNRTMNSIQLIPFNTEGVDDLVTWETIHSETPFVWLIIYLQILLRTESTKTLAG